MQQWLQHKESRKNVAPKGEGSWLGGDTDWWGSVPLKWDFIRSCRFSPSSCRYERKLCHKSKVMTPTPHPPKKNLPTHTHTHTATAPMFDFCGISETWSNSSPMTVQWKPEESVTKTNTFASVPPVNWNKVKSCDTGCVSFHGLHPHEHVVHLDHVLPSPARLHETAVKWDGLAFAWCRLDVCLCDHALPCYHSELFHIKLQKHWDMYSHVFWPEELLQS